MVRVVVSRGGATLNLSPSEESESQGMLRSFQRKGRQPSGFGRSSNVIARSGFLISQAGRKGFEVQQSAIAGRLQARGFKVVKSAGGRVIGSLSPSGERATVVEGFVEEAKRKLGITEPKRTKVVEDIPALPTIKGLSIPDKIKTRLKEKFSIRGLKKLHEEIKAGDVIQERQREIARQKGVKQLIKEGQLPRAVIRSFEVVGEGLFTASDIIRQRLFGGERLSDEDITRGGAILGEIGLFVGFAPVMTTRGEIIAKLPRDTVVKFIGKQTAKGKKIITDVVFVSSGKRIGIARGVTIPKGKDAVTLTTGISGKRGIKFPTGKLGIFEKRAFLGVEKARVKPHVFKRVARTKLLDVKQNIKGLLQLSGGRLVQFNRGFISPPFKRVVKFPTAKIIKVKRKKGFEVDDFISLAGIFTKKDLSLIVGKTLTTKGDVIKFIGLITGRGRIGSKGFVISPNKLPKFKQALNQVISVASSSVKANKVKGLSFKSKSAIAQISPVIPTVKAVPTPAKVKVKVKPKVKVVSKPTTKQRLVIEKKVKSATAQTSAQDQKITQKIRQLQKQKSKAKVKTRQKITQMIRQLQKQKQRLAFKLKLKVKQITKQKPKAKVFVKIKPKAKPKIIPIGLRKKVPRVTKKKKRKKKGYSTFARPLKKKGVKKKPKLIKISKVPLKKKKAKSLGAYVVDTSLSRTFRIKRTGKKPRKPKLRVPANYFKRKRKKFRSFKTIKGKRVSLKNKWIEKRKSLLDTKQEKKKIGLKRRIAQLEKRVDFKPTKKKVVKRTASPSQLKALAKGRAKLNMMRKKK